MPGKPPPRKPKANQRGSIRAAAQSAAASGAAGAATPRPAAAAKAATPPKAAAVPKATTRPKAAAMAKGAAAAKPMRRSRPRPQSAPDAAPAPTRVQWEDPEPEELVAADQPEFEEYEVPVGDDSEAEPFPPFVTGGGFPPFDAQRTLGEWLESLVPAEAQLHFLNAGREFAAGVQVTLDHHTGRRPSAADGGSAHHIDIE